MRCHLQPMPLGRRTAADYVSVAGEEQVERVREAAAPLKSKRVLHVASAGTRLRSPELLPALLSLLRELGIQTEYQVLAGDRPLWRLTRQLEDGLLGGETAIADDTWQDYIDSVPQPDGFDAIVVHGPGPLAMARTRDTPVVWHCELDASGADPDTVDRLKPLIDHTTESDVPEAIDPLAPGNAELPIKLAGSMLRAAGVDLSRPCCCQIRPFDSWQDPHEVIDAFAIARDATPGLQLVMAGDPARGDVEAWRLLQEVSDYADGQPDVLLLTGPAGLGSVELGALRALARTAVESELAPGPQLNALETLWRGTPVVKADTPEEMAEHLVELVQDPGLAIELGAAGQKLVRERHLITHAAEKELHLLASFQSA